MICSQIDNANNVSEFLQPNENTGEILRSEVFLNHGIMEQWNDGILINK